MSQSALEIFRFQSHEVIFQLAPSKFVVEKLTNPGVLLESLDI